jgi:hypothetical protein
MRGSGMKKFPLMNRENLPLKELSVFIAKPAEGIFDLSLESSLNQSVAFVLWISTGGTSPEREVSSAG